MAADRKGQLQVLLKQQLEALGKVVDCNKAISQLLSESGLEQLAVPTEKLQNLALPMVPSNTKGSGVEAVATLEEPLLQVESSDKPQLARQDAMRGRMFADADALKNELVKQLMQGSVTEDSQYCETGVWQSIARHDGFKNAALAVILLNTLWMAYDTDNNKADVLCNAPLLFQVVNNAFCFFFTFEIVVRFMAFERKSVAFKEPAFLFDAFLVSSMIWETWIQVALYLMSSHGHGKSGSASMFRVFRLFRIARSARALRLLRVVPELMIYVKGVFAGLRSVLVTLSMLLLVIYIFAIMFTQTVGDDPAFEDFSSVPESMHSLLVQGIFPEQAEILNKLKDQAGLAFYFLYLFYMVVGSLTIANMLIGVLCDVVQRVAEAETSAMAEAALEQKVREIVSQINGQDCEVITETEFYHSILLDHDVIKQLAELEVDVPALVDYAQQFLFLRSKQMKVKDFKQMLLHLRGSNVATVQNLVDMRNLILMKLSNMEDTVSNMQKNSAAAEGPWAGA